MEWDIAVVMTTINVPYLLNGYINNLRKYSHSNVGFLIIGDNKTPNNDVNKYLKKFDEPDCEIEYWDISKQKNWLKDHNQLEGIIPYNSDNRRNIGYLVAGEKGSRIIISIDDDNYCSGDDFFSLHSIVGRNVDLPCVRSSNRWFNPCQMLIKKPERNIYPRGFPFVRRWQDSIELVPSTGKVMLNMGLWLGDPDVDAITNLAEPIKIDGLSKEYKDNVILDKDVFAPINTQNTAFHAQILPAYYYVRMGIDIGGVTLDRYGDIWSGFFVKKIIDHIGNKVTIGRPLSDHRRNIHNLLNDLQNEIWGMIITEEMTSWLENIEVSGKSYSDAYLSLAAQIKNFHPGIRNETVKKNIIDYFKDVSKYMEVWVDACDSMNLNTK